jgi:putative two-component system response regulator
MLRADSKTANIPVIFLTAYNNDAVEALCLETGAADFITKPFDIPVLLDRIAHHLGF